MPRRRRPQAKTRREIGCVKCGLEAGRWSSPAGYQAHGDSYCCEACASDTGCMCVGAPEDARFTRFARGESLGGQAGV